MSRRRYLDLMEQVVGAYSDEQIQDYLSQVKTEGITEHGFPRLGANLGILLAHGRVKDKKEVCRQILELCCAQIPNPAELPKGMGNDFSVRELVLCLLELENADVFPKADIDRWKACLAKIEPHKTYNVVPSVPATAIGNWAAFNALSEQARNYAGLAHTEDYIENAVASQLFSFDENGMYRDPNEPMVYDLVTRVQLSALLFFGYRGKFRERLDGLLEKSAMYTLLMQSTTGEIPFGGRSNQFLHNEAHLAAMCEYEALRYRDRGDLLTAGAFKSAADLALNAITRWWGENPDHHIKNYYPIYSQMGCEQYAYYNKYMVTVASFLHLAYLFADDSIPATQCPANSGGSHTWQTGPHFHKLFCKGGSYFLELEMQGDAHYDASGIGRIQRRGAPGAICLATSVSQKPKYHTGDPNPCPMAICPGTYDGKWQFAWDKASKYCVTDHCAVAGGPDASWEVTLPGGSRLAQNCRISKDGVSLVTEGCGRIGMMLPVFSFDGTEETQIVPGAGGVSVTYHGWRCSFETESVVTDTGLSCVNRNGKYRIFRAEADGKLSIQIKIVKLP